MEQRSKRILIISGTVPPEESATAILIGKLLPEIQKQGYRVDMLTLKHSYSDSPVDAYGEMTVYRADGLLYAPAKRKCLRDVLFAMSRRFVRIKMRGLAPVYKKLATCAIEHKMKTLPMNEYDAVIAVCAYYDAAEALRRYMGKHPLRGRTALYQVDPLAENKIYIRDNEAELQQYEKSLYEKMDRVFTTPIIYKAKQERGWDMSNVTALEFPLSIKKNVAQVGADEQIRCVYAGFLYGTIRDASYTLDLFSKLENSNIHLYMLGKGQEDLLRAYENGPLKGRLHILGEKPTAECDEILSKANVLVNIGNMVNNQVPSKLLHYISFGKPILNITACEDCPTLPYMHRYPLALSIRDTKTADTDTVRVAQAWLEENRDRIIQREEIMQIFEDCTPRYITKTILKNL